MKIIAKVRGKKPSKFPYAEPARIRPEVNAMLAAEKYSNTGEPFREASKRTMVRLLKSF